jgi:peroxiredoxin family protein
MLDSIDKILKDDKSSNGDKIAACRIIADISGLKTSNINDSRKKAVDKDTLEAIEKQLGLNYKANKKA